MLEMPIHSPVQRIQYRHPQAGVLQIDIKRDDLIHPYISGNKWRKLQYHLQEARKLQKTNLLSFGGAWSNHLLALAFAGAQFKFTSTALVRGEPVSNPMLQMAKLMGMELHFISRGAYRDKVQLEKTYTTENTYCIPEGAYSHLGAKGCGEILHELEKQYAHIFCACGTGTTLAGLANAGKAWPYTHFHGIPVLKPGAYLHQEIDNLYPGLDNYSLHTEYHFGGYGKTKPELLAFVQDFSAQTGVLIEPTYTAKALYGLFDLMHKGNFLDQEVLFIHTGGLSGLLGHLDKIIPGT